MMNKIEEAIIYATVMHQGKVRKLGNIPYILHPLEVAQILSTITDDQDVITAGILHDIVEDTDGTLQEIEKRFGERVALNMPIQGTAADIIKAAMVRVAERIEREGLQARLLLQVHDELIVECPRDEAERVRALLTEEMEHVADFSVPLTVDAKIGTTWAEAH